MASRERVQYTMEDYEATEQANDLPLKNMLSSEP